MRFEYKRPVDTIVEAYGKTYDIPPKTAALVDGVNAVNKILSKSNISTVDQIKAIRSGIACFIGEKETMLIYPDDKLDTINIDEMSAFWLLLNDISNKETQAVIDKYAPAGRNIRMSSNPKK